jgi:rhamnosyltransferase
MNIEVSIIIRTKNEEKWLSDCIEAIKNQSFKNFEIIIVDNNSKDKTVKIAKDNNCKIINIKKFFPGRAINKGINSSTGKYIVILSAHCIPANNNWLKELVKEIKKKNFAGVYGRQIPLRTSSDKSKRDLLITFGLDKKIQISDPFFHNANSIIKKKIWKKIPFDNFISNIEDRIWASKILKQKYKICYTPKAIVYHYHGIHHDDNSKRLRRTVKILENVDSRNRLLSNGKLKKQNNTINIFKRYTNL